MQNFDYCIHNHYLKSRNASSIAVTKSDIWIFRIKETSNLLESMQLSLISMNKMGERD